MANQFNTGGARGRDGAYRRSAPSGGTRFKTSGSEGRLSSQPSAYRQAPPRRAASAPGQRGVQPAYYRTPLRPQKNSPIPIIIAGVVIAALIAAIIFFVVPAVGSLFSSSQEPSVEAGVKVEVTIPEGASGDQIASILAENHIIEDPKVYYATVREMQADMLLKPGDYLFTTLQDPSEVVQQLIDGPNIVGVTLTIQEGLTVDQTAARVEETYGIPADDFLEQAKASNYAEDYPFLEGAYDDSLEGYLYPKTYSLGDEPTCDEIIRALLDQFVVETEGLGLEEGANGLSAQEIVSLASLIERETAAVDERPLVASVIYNRLDAGMPLQIDAAIVYARGGGSDPVTYADLEIDSPYNVYQNTGLTPGPICSPSVSSIEAALNPADTSYLYYVLSPEGNGTHNFSETYEEFEKNKQAYSESVS